MHSQEGEGNGWYSVAGPSVAVTVPEVTGPPRWCLFTGPSVVAGLAHLRNLRWLMWFVPALVAPCKRSPAAPMPTCAQREMFLWPSCPSSSCPPQEQCFGYAPSLCEKVKTMTYSSSISIPVPDHFFYEFICLFLFLCFRSIIHLQHSVTPRYTT